MSQHCDVTGESPKCKKKYSNFIPKFFHPFINLGSAIYVMRIFAHLQLGLHNNFFKVSYLSSIRLLYAKTGSVLTWFP